MGIVESRRDSLERLLRSKSARALYEAIQQEPGLALSRLCSQTGLGWGGTYHHIRKLEVAGFVLRHQTGHVVRVFPVGTPKDTMESPWLSETARRVHDAIQEGAPRTVGTLANDLGLPSRVVYYHLRRLTDAGLLQRKAYRYGPIQLGSAMQPTPSPSSCETHL